MEAPAAGNFPLEVVSLHISLARPLGRQRRLDQGLQLRPDLLQQDLVPADILLPPGPLSVLCDSRQAGPGGLAGWGEAG